VKFGSTHADGKSSNEDVGIYDHQVGVGVYVNKAV
jgi:hypothetical protein